MPGLARLTLSLLCLVPHPAGAADSSTMRFLLDRAAERALAYADASLEWTCDESVRLAKYDANGDASRETERTFRLLLGRDHSGQANVELRAEVSRARASTERPSWMHGFPPFTSWMRLFHPEIGGFMHFEDRGEDDSSVPPRHAVAFHGDLPYSDGEDLREWEGTAWLDPITGDLLAVEAVPRSQTGRLARLVERRNGRSLGVTLFEVFHFRIGPVAHGRRVEISLGLHDDGFWLPHVARLETFDAVTATTTRPLRVVVNSLDLCRRFEVIETQGGATPKQH